MWAVKNNPILFTQVRRIEFMEDCEDGEQADENKKEGETERDPGVVRGNPRVVGEEGAEVAVAVLGGVAIVLVVVVGEVAVGNERGGIGDGSDGGVALHRRG